MQTFASLNSRLGNNNEEEKRLTGGARGGQAASGGTDAHGHLESGAGKDQARVSRGVLELRPRVWGVGAAVAKEAAKVSPFLLTLNSHPKL